MAFGSSRPPPKTGGTTLPHPMGPRLSTGRWNALPSATRRSRRPPAKAPPGKHQSKRTEGTWPSADELVAFHADMVNSDGFLPTNTIRDAMPSRGLVTSERLRARGVH